MLLKLLCHTKKRRVASRYLATTENKDVTFMKINIKEAIGMIIMAWKEVSNTIISNCMREANIVKKMSLNMHKK